MYNIVCQVVCVNKEDSSRIFAKAVFFRLLGLFFRIRLILQNIPWLAVQRPADRFEGGKPDCADLPGLDLREIDV